MATESKIKSGKTEKKEPTPGGRRSGRLAGTAPSAEEAKVGDKVCSPSLSKWWGKARREVVEVYDLG